MKKTVLIMLLAVLTAALTLLPGCSKEQKTPGEGAEITGFMISGSYCDFDYDFARKTLTANDHLEDPVIFKLDDSDAALYEQSIARVCDGIRGREDKFYGSVGEEAYAILWIVTIGYSDSSIQTVAATSEGSIHSPDGWDELISLTDRLTENRYSEDIEYLMSANLLR